MRNSERPNGIRTAEWNFGMDECDFRMMNGLRNGWMETSKVTEIALSSSEQAKKEEDKRVTLWSRYHSIREAKKAPTIHPQSRVA